MSVVSTHKNFRKYTTSAVKLFLEPPCTVRPIWTLRTTTLKWSKLQFEDVETDISMDPTIGFDDINFLKQFAYYDCKEMHDKYLHGSDLY